MVLRGRLRDASGTPATGEHVERLVSVRGVVVEHILSAASDVPVRYVQQQDEWVVLLSGGADLDVDGTPCRLGPGDWVLLPAEVPHTVVHTDPGTTWLAVHVGAGG